MQLRIGSPVHAEDGEAGTLERIILHPETQEVDGLVLRLPGAMARDVVLGIERVLSTGAEHISVRGTIQELEDLDPYAQSQFVLPPEDWIPPGDGHLSQYLFPASPLAVGAFRGTATQPEPPAHEVEAIPFGDADLTERTVVYCTDGAAGVVERVVTSGDSDRVTHLVVEHGMPFARLISVHVSHVESVSQSGVRLRVSRAELEQMEDAAPQ